MARYASHTGWLSSFTPPAFKPAARKGCADISRRVERSDTRGHHELLTQTRRLKACEEIPDFYSTCAIKSPNFTASPSLTFN